MPDEIASVLKGNKIMAKWPLRGRDVAGDLMLLELIAVRVCCIVRVVCMGVRCELVHCMSGEGADGFCSVGWSACVMSPLERGRANQHYGY